MATYWYRCGCGNNFDIDKRISDIDCLETCPTCGMILDSSHRMISRVYFSGEKDQDRYFCPGLGTVVNSPSHRKRLAKEKGLEEVGNEDVDKIHTMYDRQREAKAKERWDSLTKPTEVIGCQSLSSSSSMNQTQD